MSKHNHSDEVNALKVVCPRCCAWIRKPCVHTTGSKVGQPTSPHPDRIKFARASMDISPDTKKKIRAVEEAEATEVKVKTPKDKLSSDQRRVVDLILDKIYALQKHAEFVGPVTKGPVISTFRFKPLHRTKVAHIEGMVKDISLALGSEELVVVKRMPGEEAVGVFVPNKERQLITLPDTLQNVMAYMQKPTKDGHKKIPLNFGITYVGEPFVDDLTVQPHILVGGATDSGKSTLMNCFVLSLLWACKPSEVRLCISDTKKVEFLPYYSQIPHLERPIAKDRYETMQIMDYIVRETQRRLDEFGKGLIPCRNIHEWNDKNPEHKMHFIILLIDELADIMGEAIDRTEAKIAAAKLGAIVGRSRAAGIYVIAGTQTPRASIVKGTIKANFPSHVALKVSSSIDSKVILGVKGAECLMSRGDMFFQSSARSDLLRLHAPYAELNDLKELIKAVILREDIEKKKAQAKLEENEERIAIQQEGSNKPIEVRKPN